MDIRVLRDLPVIRNDYYQISYTPFISPNIFDTGWFHSISPEFREILIEFFPNFILADMTFPHDIYNRDSYYIRFLSLYKSQYHITQYSQLYSDITILKLTDEQNTELLNYIASYLSNGSIIELSKEFTNILKGILEKYPEGAFVKTQFKSAKKSGELLPVFTVNDVLSSIKGSYDILNSLLLQGPSLVFRDWDYDLDSAYEFRIYILNNTIKVISSTYYKPVKINDYDHMYATCIEFWRNIKNTFIMNSAVVDANYDNKQWKLIEINSGERWSTSGTALTTWDAIYDTDKVIILHI